MLVLKLIWLIKNILFLPGNYLQLSCSAASGKPMMNEPKEANLVMTGPRTVHELWVLGRFLATFIES